MGFGRIKAVIRVLVIVLIILPITPMISNALPAFPGAQGWGSDTIGGRSANTKLCKVNTLSDATTGSCSGNICSGSLRYCLAQHNVPGPKIVIFTVGGTIDQTVSGIGIIVREPFVTVAGQTAPGGGIQIKGVYDNLAEGRASIYIATHDVIVRGLRIRNNGDSAFDAVGDCGSWGCVYNVIADHNSMSWSNDGIAEIFMDAERITFSHNIFSEATPRTSEAHGRQGVLAGSWQDYCPNWPNPPLPRITAKDITIHHNLFAHNGQRNPLMKEDLGRNEIINNVIYNWGYAGIETFASSYIAKNVLIRGPNHTGGSPRGIRVTQGFQCTHLPLPGSVMVTHNIGPDRTTDTGDDWLAVDGGTSSYRTDSLPFTLWGVTEDDVMTVKAKILAEAGATVPYRDSADTRVISHVTNCDVGSNYLNCPRGWISSPSDVGGWPTIDSGTYPTDTDGDGMPDAWETARGLNPNDPSDWNKDRDGDGYLNIEEYINSFFPAPFALIPNPPSIIGIK